MLFVVDADETLAVLVHAAVDVLVKVVSLVSTVDVAATFATSLAASMEVFLRVIGTVGAGTAKTVVESVLLACSPNLCGLGTDLYVGIDAMETSACGLREASTNFAFFFSRISDLLALLAAWPSRISDARMSVVVASKESQPLRHSSKHLSYRESGVNLHHPHVQHLRTPQQELLALESSPPP